MITLVFVSSAISNCFLKTSYSFSVKSSSPISPIAMIFLFSIYQQATAKRILICKLFADVCWVIHYLCLGAYSGAIPAFVGMVRELVFINRGKHKWADALIWPIIFIFVNLLLGLKAFNAPVDLLPVIASPFVTFALWLKKPVLTKIISAPVSLAFLVYDIYVGSFIGVISESVSLTSLLIFFVKKARKK